MGSSSSTTTNQITSGSSHLNPFMGDAGRTFMKNIMKGSAAEEKRLDTYLANQGYPSSTYYTMGLLQPLAESMFNMEGMGRGEPFLQDYANSLDQAYGMLGTSGETLGDVRNNISGIAAGDNLDDNNPQLQNLISTIQNQVRNDVGGQFAAAGRSFSGAHSNALGSGEAAGMAQPLFTDYWNRQNQMMQANEMLGNVSSGYGNIAGAYGDLGSNYGALGNAYDLMAQNRYNIATQGVGLLSDMFTLPYQKWSNLAGVQLPISSTFGTNKWYESNMGRSNTSTSGFSDRRLKDDVAQVGALFDGTPVYRYARNGEYQIGLMADEVTPEAVSEGIYGFKMVDYKKATARAAGE